MQAFIIGEISFMQAWLLVPGFLSTSGLEIGGDLKNYLEEGLVSEVKWLRKDIDMPSGYCGRNSEAVQADSTHGW